MTARDAMIAAAVAAGVDPERAGAAIDNALQGLVVDIASSPELTDVQAEAVIRAAGIDIEPAVCIRGEGFTIARGNV